jgi:hypothetical protein
MAEPLRSLGEPAYSFALRHASLAGLQSRSHQNAIEIARNRNRSVSIVLLNDHAALAAAVIEPALCGAPVESAVKK